MCVGICFLCVTEVSDTHSEVCSVNVLLNINARYSQKCLQYMVTFVLFYLEFTGFLTFCIKAECLHARKMSIHMFPK